MGLAELENPAGIGHELALRSLTPSHTILCQRLGNVGGPTKGAIMVQKAEVIWFDGKWVPWDDCNVHVLSHTLHYGLGVFEGIRSYIRADGRSAIFRLRDHMERFVKGAAMMTMPLDFTVDELVEAAVETCKRNRLRSCYLRPLAFLGAGGMGVGSADNPVHVSIATWPWGAYLGEEALTAGVRVKISTFVRPHQNSQLHKGKVCGHYVNSILAKREAIREGYHEAIMLDTQGFVCEATGENVFAVLGGEIYTAPFGAAILGGLTRNTVLEIANELDFKVREESFTRDVLYLADEVFMVGTAAEVTPVREIDGRVIGSGKPGPVTQAIQSAYFDIVKGHDDAHDKWLTYYEVPAH